MGWVKKIGFIRTAEFGLALGCALTALAFGTDPIVMWCVLTIGWILAALGILSTDTLRWPSKTLLCTLILLTFAAEGVFLYEHDNKVSVLNINSALSWLVHNTAVQLLLAACLGFAIHVLYLRVQQKYFARRTLAALRGSPLQKGFLDYQMDVEASAQRISTVLTGATKQQLRFSEAMARQTKKIGPVAQKLRNGKNSGYYLRKVHKIAAETGAMMDAYAARITEADAKFSDSATTLITTIDWLLAHQQGYRNETSIGQMIALRDACGSARESLGKFSTAVDGLHGIEANLNQSCDRTILATNSFIKTMLDMEAVANRVVADPPLTAPTV